MDTYLEEIVSGFIDALHTDTAPAIDVFLARYPDIPESTIAGLTTMLGTIAMLYQQATQVDRLSVEERGQRIRQKVIARIRQEVAEAEHPAQSSPTIGEWLGQTLQQTPEAITSIGVPANVLSKMLADPSPIELIHDEASTRLQFAQRYAPDNPSLLTGIAKLLNRLNSLWLQSQDSPHQVYARRAPTPGDVPPDKRGDNI